MTSVPIDKERNVTAGLGAPARTPMTLRDILTPLFFFKRRAIIALIIPIVLALVAAMMARPTYVAEARMLILLGNDYVMRNPLGGAVPGLSFDRSQIVHAETEIIESRELAIQTLRAVGVERVYPRIRGANRLQYAAVQFQTDLATENVPESNVVNVTLRNGDAKVAAEALNKLIGFYMVRRRQVFEQTDTASIDRQSASLNRQLDEVEQQLARFAAEHKFGQYEQELTGIQTQRLELMGQLASLDQQLATRNGQSRLLADRRASTPADIDLSTDFKRSQQIANLTENLLSLETQYREAVAQYVPGHPIIQDLEQRVAKLKADIASAPSQNTDAVRRGVNPVRQHIETNQADVASDAAGIAQGRAQTARNLDQVNRRLNELAALGPTYRGLLRTRTILEAEVTDLARQSQSSKLANSLSRSQANVRVIQAAEPPIKSHTGRMVMLLAGVAVGLIAAAGATMISVAIFQGMITPNEVESKLMTPVVLTLPDVEPQDRPPEMGLPVPMFLTRDEMKVLGHLLKTLAPGPNCSVQLIGATDEVGVTSLLVDIAILTAREGQKVLLLDLEPRRGASASELLQARGATLNPLDTDSGVAQVNDSGLHVTLPIGSVELTMGEAEWARLIKQACREYNMVLIDAPPLSRSWLGVFVAPSVNATLAVVAAEETRAPVALNLIERIGGAGGEVQAVILNKRRFYIPKVVYNWF